MGIINLQIELFILMGIGFILAKKGYFSLATQNQLSNIILMIILPCSIIKSFQIDFDSHLLYSIITILLISFGIQFLYFILNKYLYNKMEIDKKVCCQYATMVSNAGFLGMPIAQAVFGDIGLLYASVFLIPQRIFMWSSGITLFTQGKQSNVIKQVLTHPCIIAIYIGLILMILRSFHIFLPASLSDTISLIGQCSTALSMFIIGGILSQVDMKTVFDPESVLYSLSRLIIIPFIIFCILRVFNFNGIPANLCVLLSAMPAASTTTILAQKYGGNALFASKLVFVSTLFSLITLPIVTVIIITI